MRLRAAILGVVVLAAAALAGAARSAGPGFTLVDAGTALFPDRAFVITLDAKRELSAANVTVRENGKPVNGVAVGSAAAEGGSLGIGTVLLIDASNSMKTSIDEAMSAARAFAARNPGTPLAVVAFNARPTVMLPFTADKAAIGRALARSPRLGEGTRIWDALAAAQAQIRGSGVGAGRIVLLSDGDDVGSITSKQAAIDALSGEKVRVFTVGISSPDFTESDLEDVAHDTGGTYALASSKDSLHAIYDTLGYKLSNEYILRYRSPARPGKDVKVSVSIEGLAGHASYSYTSPSIGSATPYETRFVDKLLQSWALMVFVAFLVVGLVVYSLGKAIEIRRNRRLVRRLSRFVSLDEEDAAARREEVESLLARRKATRLRFGDWAWTDRFGVELELAGITAPAQRIVFLSLAAGLIVAIVAGALISPFWIVLGVLVPVLIRAEISRRATRTRRTFGEQLPDNLEVLGSALRAGHSLVGAMSIVVDEAAEPSRKEFRRIVTDEQLGIPLEETLELTARRMDSRDVEQVAIVAVLQREAGSNMAEVLDRVVENIRARQDILRLVRTLTAQGRLARWILSLLPVFILVAILLINPDHLQPLFHRATGQVALVMASIMVIIGSLIINKIVKIRV